MERVKNANPRYLKLYVLIRIIQLTNFLNLFVQNVQKHLTKLSEDLL